MEEKEISLEKYESPEIFEIGDLTRGCKPGGCCSGAF